MKRKKLLSAMAVFGLMTFATEAQGLSLNVVVKVDLACELQPGSTNNFKINTKTLLNLIANDQGFTVPDNARLWLDGRGIFYILNPNNTVFRFVDTNLLSVTYDAAVYKSNYKPPPPNFKSTANGTEILSLTYNGSLVSFKYNCYGKYLFYNASNGTNAIAITSFSGMGFGPGTCNGQNMIVTGSFDGSYTMRYSVASSNQSGTFMFGDSNQPSVLGTFPGASAN